ncbi:MAG: ATP-binding protein [Erysipelotrichaceae bacterium]|nr:ATP-binding protein [Erysipelotrichaceae bacterium]
MKKLSTSIENFKEIIDDNYYYIDKTMFIKEAINEKFALYTRPRRFGKTLNMSMLYYFFSIKEKDNAYLFDGLKISKDKQAIKHQNQYPVIFITLKDMNRGSYDLQISKFGDIIKDVVLQYPELKDSDFLDESEKIKLNSYRFEKASEGELMDSLKNLSTYLYKHYHKKVVILIDEYDVPLSDAYSSGYYDKMSKFIAGTFSAGLKTNNYLERGIFTGCLRISKESIFTGLNNFNVYSITEIRSSDKFGFTFNEVQDLCNYYKLDDKINTIKEWYDGYLFGNTEIYNPWSVLKYIDQTLQGIDEPISFWANTSGNSIVKEYIDKADNQLHDEFQLLIQGDYLEKKVAPELTYREMDRISNIYSFLLFTGYLKIHQIIDRSQNIYELEIPNKEIKDIYMTTFNEWFNDYTVARKPLLMEALLQQDEKKAQSILIQILNKTISYHDEVEAFYHGFLGGLLVTNGYNIQSNDEYKIQSNKESGDGRFDLSVVPEDLNNPCIIIECKISKERRKLKSDSQDAINQVIEKKYMDSFIAEGYDLIYVYGIAFYKKTCFITRLQNQ